MTNHHTSAISLMGIGFGLIVALLILLSLYIQDELDRQFEETDAIFENLSQKITEKQQASNSTGTPSTS